MPTDDSSYQPDQNRASEDDHRLREPTPEDVADDVRKAASLEELRELFGVESIHEAYFRAKNAWNAAIKREQKARPE
ncbi:MAG: hypothetical protein V5A46_01060, partial [Haloferacaceae archaeon]